MTGSESLDESRCYVCAACGCIVHESLGFGELPEARHECKQGQPSSYAQLAAENEAYRDALERIRDWRGFRHTGEVRDCAGSVLQGRRR